MFRSEVTPAYEDYEFAECIPTRTPSDVQAIKVSRIMYTGNLILIFEILSQGCYRTSVATTPPARNYSPVTAQFTLPPLGHNSSFDMW
jgi:hypothetical protein